MREIKFRAYQDNGMLYQKISGIYGTESFFNCLYEDCKLMQFTCKKDKKGKEIYEGDIVKVNGTKRIGEYITEIIFEAPNFKLKENKTYLTDIASFIAIIEVVGNIYENPELLR